MRSVFGPTIVILALAAGIIHLSLDVVLFHFHFGGRPGAPLQARMLPYLFLLNFAGFVVLSIMFVLASHAAAAYRVGVDALIGVMAVATLVGWMSYRHPNPMGLGALAVTVELLLIVSVVAHIATLRRRPAPVFAR